jgi:aspartyl-tRNA(Asn)/glutamyl-tRNA(Gln) amidotransferase subunit A
MPTSHSRMLRDRVERAIAQAEDPAGDGSRVFTCLFPEEARVAADAADIRRQLGTSLGPLDGHIVSVKDVFDVAGHSTTAGSKVYADAPPARQDASVVARLRAAGAILIGRTNMTEFGFSGLGINPHFGTPGNSADRSRIPGGSSSGAAVSVAGGYCDIAIGTDTSGSVRIPASFNGLIGFKPTQARVPRDGVIPLSLTLDTVGPLARSVQDAADAHAIVAGESPRTVAPYSLAGLRIGVLGGSLLSRVDPDIAWAFEWHIERIRFEKAALTELNLDTVLAKLDAIEAIGSFSAVEAAWYHRHVLAKCSEAIDRHVLKRILTTSAFTAAQYVEMGELRRDAMATVDGLFRRVDVMSLPTVAIPPPRFADLVDDRVFEEFNLRILRNTNIFNLLDLPAITVPIPDAGVLPVGLMLVGRRGDDETLIDVASAIERLPRRLS